MLEERLSFHAPLCYLSIYITNNLNFPVNLETEVKFLNLNKTLVSWLKFPWDDEKGLKKNAITTDVVIKPK